MCRKGLEEEAAAQVLIDAAPNLPSLTKLGLKNDDDVSLEMEGMKSKLTLAFPHVSIECIEFDD
jgi:hypothetical protein